MIFKPSPTNLQLAAEALKNNQLVGLPTETVYGLAANALSPEAIQKIYQLKGRPSTNPLIVHIADFEQIHSLTGELSTQQRSYLNLLKKFWPGPLTIILPKSDLIPMIVTANSASVAIRIPNHPVALDLLRKSSVPVAAPSANRSNYISPTSAQHVDNEFGTELELIIDGGECTVGLESTIVSLVTSPPQILRPGAITLQTLQSIIPEIVLVERSVAREEEQASPGQQIKHYSPKTRLDFKTNYKPTAEEKKVAYVAFHPLKELEQKNFFSYKLLSQNGDLNEVAQKLFATLRELDHQGLDLILIDDCHTEDIGLAIMDRLKRAVTK